MGLLTAIAGGLLGNSAQKAANRTNIKLQREQQAWQERMANTSYQRATADLLQANLNPMLAYQQGGATTPNVQPAHVEPTSALGSAVARADGPIAIASAMASLRAANLQNDTADENLQMTKFRNNLEKGYRNPDDPNSQDQLKRRREIAEAKLRETDVDIREIERKIAQSTMGNTIGSAAAREKLLKQEFDINEIRSILMTLDIPEKEAMADWFSTIGSASPAMKAVMNISSWLKYIFGGR